MEHPLVSQIRPVTTTVSVPDAGTAATSDSEESIANDSEDDDDSNAGDQALAFLDVFVMGFGDSQVEEESADENKCASDESSGELNQNCEQL